MDVEQSECSPDPIRSSYKRPQDAQHDLMNQAVDGRIRGHVAVSSEVYVRTGRAIDQVSSTAGGAAALPFFSRPSGPLTWNASDRVIEKITGRRGDLHSTSPSTNL
jgi:hypothetical protein